MIQNLKTIYQLVILNGFWKARTIWDSSRSFRPQGVGHDHEQPVGSTKFFSKAIESKLVEDDNNEWFQLVSGGQDHLGQVQIP